MFPYKPCLELYAKLLQYICVKGSILVFKRGRYRTVYRVHSLWNAFVEEQFQKLLIVSLPLFIVYVRMTLVSICFLSFIGYAPLNSAQLRCGSHNRKKKIAMFSFLCVILLDF